MHKNSPAPHQLVAALSQYLKVNLQLENGVCALFDKQQLEMCIIELLPMSTTAILHCAMGTRSHAPDRHSQLLKLNLQPDKLNGCWLALDETGEERLCAQCPMVFLTEESFCQWVTGFIEQVGETRALLSHTA